ncbi:MAG: hypothetical protein WC838_06395, partial [Candidatus Margulisiibacteriota bacterium]
MLRIFKRMDLPLLLAICALLFMSVFIILSASSIKLENKDLMFLNLFKHLFAFIIGTTMFILLVLFDYKLLSKFWWVLYGLAIALLAYILY